MKLHYRHHKYGEPLEKEPETAQNVSDEEGEDVWKELGGKETLARLKRIEEQGQKGISQVEKMLKQRESKIDEISDLHSIPAEDDREDSEDGLEEFVRERRI